MVNCFAFEDECGVKGCEAVARIYFNEFYAKRICGSMNCPFYKPERSNTRLSDVIYNSRGEVVEKRGRR